MSAGPAVDAALQTVQRFRGALLGGASGDALGAAVEFMQRTEILGWFGPAGIRDFAPVDGRLGTITDDTQLTLFCAEAILRVHAAGARRDDLGTHAREQSRSYLRWLLTQGEAQTVLDDPHSYLMQHPDLFHRRGPGTTCLSSLRAMRVLGERAFNTSKGCGGVMRVAPLGLFHSHWLHDSVQFDAMVFDAGATDAALTHGHASGHLPAGYLALLIALVAAGVPLDAALSRSRQQLAARPGHEAALAGVDRALRLAAEAALDPTQLASLGLGWFGDEALAMALYCAVSAEEAGADFETAVALAVNHDGDSDSTGAITGTLLGALRGEAAIPPRWLDQLELRGLVATIAEDLASAPRWAADSAEQLRYRAR
jgi:ADP-ribosylglycohydrolase